MQDKIQLSPPTIPGLYLFYDGKQCTMQRVDEHGGVLRAYPIRERVTWLDGAWVYISPDVSEISTAWHNHVMLVTRQHIRTALEAGPLLKRKLLDMPTPGATATLEDAIEHALQNMEATGEIRITGNMIRLIATQTPTPDALCTTDTATTTPLEQA
jgi:hypothetical protein